MQARDGPQAWRGRAAEPPGGERGAGQFSRAEGPTADKE